MISRPAFSFRWLRVLAWLWLPAAALCSSCASSRYYNQRTMFQLSDGKGLDTTKLRVAVNRTARNYRIQPNDYLDVRVYTNKGERILDPNGELQFGQPAGRTPALAPRANTTAAPTTGRNVGQGASGTAAGTEFLVQADGTVQLPMVDRVKLSGLSLLQADSALQVRYGTFYKEVFVTTRVTNNRVVVLGAPGGVVVPLANDNMNLLEVLALAGGLDGGQNNVGLNRFGGKASNIRIIRGDLKNPQVQQIDLTTIAGMRRANLQVEPNDIIYVEPARRRFIEGLTDAGPAISLAALLLNTTLVIINITR